MGVNAVNRAAVWGLFVGQGVAPGDRVAQGVLEDDDSQMMEGPGCEAWRWTVPGKPQGALAGV